MQNIEEKSISSIIEVIISLLIMVFVLIIINITALKDYQLIYSLIPVLMLLSLAVFGIVRRIVLFWIILIAILSLIYRDFRYIGMIYPLAFLFLIRITMLVVRK
ncbi:MAG: hypothetical protein N3B13_02905 [Deltaproteobacteria bacterium]|nr:hypothetical protein [Deltaproteobacteria bacterium]